jgi:uncharacterized protein YecA (UPF0149 family)
MDLDDFKEAVLSRYIDISTQLGRNVKILPQGSATHLETRRIGRNAPCPCGSGKKYKKCCLRKQEEQGRGIKV